MSQANAVAVNQTAPMFVEQRIEPRESLSLPLTLGDGCPAVTRDISASGMYLKLDGLHSLTGSLVFEMSVADLGVKLTAECEVVRVEHRDGHTGVAVKLRTPRFEPLV